MGNQLTFGSFMLYLDRVKVERETKHGGHKREHSIGSGHDGKSFKGPVCKNKGDPMAEYGRYLI